MITTRSSTVANRTSTASMLHLSAPLGARPATVPGRTRGCGATVSAWTNVAAARITMRPASDTNEPQDAGSTMSAIPLAALAVFFAQDPSGFAPRAAAAERDFETRLLAVPDTASVRRMSRDLTRVPHVAGTPAQAATRDYVIAQMKAWGLETWTKEYTVYLPQPETVAAWVQRRAGARPVP